MKKSRRSCCIDTNILFDFIAGDIVDALFLLPFDYHTVDIVTIEISETYSENDLRELGIRILEIDGDTVLEIDSLKQDHVELSLQDASLLVISRNHTMMILSNDGPLRQLADDSGIDYHGTLWLLGELIRGGILSPEDAAAALRTMRSKKRWLPQQECDRLLKEWDPGK